MDPKNKYSKMQQKQYDAEAAIWNPGCRDPVVGSFDRHNAWPDYDEFLFKSIDTSNKIALDFGCGPGRNIVKFDSKFLRIDGVDISDLNLSNAEIWCQTNSIPAPNLFKNNGIDLELVPSNSYDIVFSTICLQHICVHEIRFSLIKEFYRVLKVGGYVCLQMGFGDRHPYSVGYFENNYDATISNSGCDTRINSPEEPKSDLEKIGFHSFDYDIRPTGPGDHHSNWIFLRAIK